VATPFPADPQENERPVFRSNVNLVSLYFNVKDKQGSPIRQLSKDDFLVTDNGRPQVIRYFAAEATQPLTLSILIDTSGSLKGAIAAEQETAAEFLRQVLRENDRAGVVVFDMHVFLLQEFTGSVPKLMKAFEKIFVGAGSASGRLSDMDRVLDGPVGLRPVGDRMILRLGGTLLRDAVTLTARKTLSPETGRKAMIVLTDGVDQGSSESIGKAIQAAQEADVVAYVILFNSPPDQPGFGRGEMKKLTFQTGGREIKVGADRTKLKEALAQIAAELHSQYYIGYTPADANFDGEFHKIAIKTGDPAYRVQSRTGYYARKDSK
jgi:VWFA-related protein